MFRFFSEPRGKRNTFGAQIIPQKGRGLWITLESDLNGRIFVRVDQSVRKMPVTLFMRAFGPETKKEVFSLFEDDQKAHEAIEKTLALDTADSMDDVWVSFYKMLRTGSVVNANRAKDLVQTRFSPEWYDLSELGRLNFNKRFNLPVDAKALKNRILTLQDIVLITKEIVRLNNTPEALADDRDHLGFRRVRSVGELVYEYARTGFVRMRKNTKDKMLTADPKTLELPTNVLYIRTFQSTIHGFFNTNQLSQPLKQQNILTHLEHLRTVSALGTGGVNREHASVSVRDIHQSHYGRICPVHSPEGPSIGLILHLSPVRKN